MSSLIPSKSIVFVSARSSASSIDMCRSGEGGGVARAALADGPFEDRAGEGAVVDASGPCDLFTFLLGREWLLSSEGDGLARDLGDMLALLLFGDCLLLWRGWEEGIWIPSEGSDNDFRRVL